ncbi:hypothetical protein L6452_17454 [Arctium lappa]|uniref:Uncharacterized protein n=1 Tax=Arctium lappa TaxID=4217 RepID=A0ACB9C3L6_ARCLA|nr:hypothetical protein L6452_17454 [Arctium lappa]
MVRKSEGERLKSGDGGVCFSQPGDGNEETESLFDVIVALEIEEEEETNGYKETFSRIGSMRIGSCYISLPCITRDHNFALEDENGSVNLKGSVSPSV